MLTSHLPLSRNTLIYQAFFELRQLAELCVYIFHYLVYFFRLLI